MELITLGALNDALQVCTVTAAQLAMLGFEVQREGRALTVPRYRVPAIKAAIGAWLDKA